MDWKSPERLDGGGIAVPETWLFLHYYEAFNILFRLENALRLMVYATLKVEYLEKWADISIESGTGDATIAKVAKQRAHQARTFGYLGFPVTSPLMYLTAGELVGIILSDAYWPLFARQFPAGKSVLETKFAEINSVRNALAHFRPIGRDDVETIKQVSKHVFEGAEKTLYDLVTCADTVPSNSATEWYKSLSTLGTDICTLTFSQSADESWVQVGLITRLQILSVNQWGSGMVGLNVTNVDAPAILKEFPDLTKRVIYLIEDIGWSRVIDGRPQPITKEMKLGFHREVLTRDHKDIHGALQRLLGTITEESELIAQDHLAQGRIVRTARTASKGDHEKGQAHVDREWLRSKLEEGDPVEWWGDMELYVEDFISAADRYPWMPVRVSHTAFPF